MLWLSVLDSLRSWARLSTHILPFSFLAPGGLGNRPCTLWLHVCRGLFTQEA